MTVSRSEDFFSEHLSEASHFRADGLSEASRESGVVHQDKRDESGVGDRNTKERPPSRVQELATYLRDLAMKKGPESKLPTARELGSMFSMSQNTVNATLELLEAQHVLVRRQGSGIYVSPKIYRKSICILFYSDIFRGGGDSPFWGIFWSLFAEEMERRIASDVLYATFHMVTQVHHDTRDLPEDVVVMIQRGNVHGVMAVGIDAPTWQWLREQHIPVVSFAGPGDYFVGLDREQQFDLGLSQLIEHGCRSIGIWLASADLNHSDSTMTMARSILEAHGAQFDPALIKYGTTVTTGLRSTSLQKQGYDLAREVFGSADMPRPDGIFIPVDMLTAGALVAFNQLQITPGRDLPVATHTNKGSSVFFGSEQHLIQVEIDPAEIVQAMFTQMEVVLAGQHPPMLLVPSSLRTSTE